MGKPSEGSLPRKDRNLSKSFLNHFGVQINRRATTFNRDYPNAFPNSSTLRLIGARP